MSAIRGKAVAIVGGGPGGLTLARLLQLRGVNVQVFERDTSRQARITGSALDLHADSGLAALKAAGLIDVFWANHRPELDRLRLMNNRGDVLYDHERGHLNRPEIERMPLRNLLLDSLHPDTVVWNRKYEGATASGDKVQLRFAGAESVTADLVVGADGANSRLRPLVTDVKPAYVGVTLVEGVVPDAATHMPELCTVLGDSAIMAFGAEQTLGLSKKADGSILFYAGLKSPSELSKQEIEQANDRESRVAWFRQYFAEWSGMWSQLFAHAQSFAWRPLYTYPANHRWKEEREANVTLLGDAAHVIPPYAGEGVNMAMLDALVLSRELEQQPDITAAIAAFEKEMFARMEGISSTTMSNTEMFYAADAGAQMVNMFKRFARRPADTTVPKTEPISDLPN